MRRKSVLDGLRVRQCDDIQDEINEMVDCRSEMTEGKFLEVNETKSNLQKLRLRLHNTSIFGMLAHIGAYRTL